MIRLALILLMILVPDAQAQIGLPNVRLPALPQVPLVSTVSEDAKSDLQTLRDVRRLAVRDLIRRNRTVLQADRKGAAIVRGEIIAISPEQAAIDAATAAGFTVLRTRVLEGLDAQIVVLGVPTGMDTLRALDKLRALAPSTGFDYNHIYTSSGVVRTAADAGAAPAAGPTAAAGPPITAGPTAAGGPPTTAGPTTAVGPPTTAGPTTAAGPPTTAGAGGAPAAASAVGKVGLIDSGVDVSHPVFKDVTIHQHGCSSAPIPEAHGTAVASLLIGRSPDFHGSAAGAELYAADVYCGLPTGGAADVIADAFSWLAHERVAVINVSLVGPPNVTLEAVVRLLVARGYLVVAAVGNDGPAAPPLYPASYPGVVGVTGVDAHRRVLFEAGRGPQVRFAAPGADMSAAKSTQTFELVRGTSFASPIVAGLLSARLPAPDPAGAQQAVEGLAREAVDLGASGTDPVYGAGLVGADLAPAARLAATAAR